MSVAACLCYVQHQDAAAGSDLRSMQPVGRGHSSADDTRLGILIVTVVAVGRGEDGVGCTGVQNLAHRALRVMLIVDCFKGRIYTSKRVSVRKRGRPCAEHHRNGRGSSDESATQDSLVDFQSFVRFFCRNIPAEVKASDLSVTSGIPSVRKPPPE